DPPALAAAAHLGDPVGERGPALLARPRRLLLLLCRRGLLRLRLLRDRALAGGRDVVALVALLLALAAALLALKPALLALDRIRVVGVMPRIVCEPVVHQSRPPPPLPRAAR